MNPEFWKGRWAEGRIGFHEGRANTLLSRHIERLGANRRVLVPLCGKSEDLAFLRAQGHEVVGVELVPDALQAFFREHDLSPTETKSAHARVFEAEGFRLLAGDFFACTNADVGEVNAFYDRAAIVALPPELRKKYVAHLRTLLPRGARGIVIAFDYPQAKFEGPPFSVPEAELRSLYEGASLELTGEVPATGPRFAEAGIEVRERCFLVTL